MSTSRPETWMVWQNFDTHKSITVEMVIKWGKQHFEEKYAPVKHVACHNSISLEELSKAFPDITFWHEHTIYTPSLFYFYAETEINHYEDFTEE